MYTAPCSYRKAKKARNEYRTSQRREKHNQTAHKDRTRQDGIRTDEKLHDGMLPHCCNVRRVVCAVSYVALAGFSALPSTFASFSISCLSRYAAFLLDAIVCLSGMLSGKWA